MQLNVLNCYFDDVLQNHYFSYIRGIFWIFPIVVDSFNGIYSSLLLLAFTKSNTNSKYMNSLIEWGQWNVKLLIFF